MTEAERGRSLNRQERLKRTLLECEGLDDPRRERYLSLLGVHDPGLERELRELLAQRTSPEIAGSAVGEAMSEAVRRADLGSIPEGPQASSPGSPRTLGPYLLCEVLGSGGMGVVYRADQTSPIRREVAVKLLRGGLRPEKIVARFRAEQDALSRMDHPGIARIYDVGADDAGTPYLVMELVRGVPITGYCASHDFSPRETLPLFVDVCRAIQHAHQKGIIHRDLKPTNILVSEVDGRPVAKVIDFGIARIVEEGDGAHVSLTGEGQLVGTLEYMSPEQAAGRSREIDTRTDVYSLGAVLYQLLTGELPHDLRGKTLAEAVEIIKGAPPRPFGQTGAGRRADSDLETIVRKALEIDPGRRYEGPGALADDVERYLRAEPIVARPSSTTYQLKTFVRRNKVAVAVVSGAFLFLGVFAVTMSVMYAGQRREREHAQTEADKARVVNQFLQDMLSAADPAQMGKDVTVRQVTDRSIATLDASFGRQPEVLATIQQTLSRTYLALGESQRADSLGRVVLARERQLHGEQSREVASSLEALARIAYVRGDFKETDSLASLALAIVRKGRWMPSKEQVEGLHMRGLAALYPTPYRAVLQLEACDSIARLVLPSQSAEILDLEQDLASAYEGVGRSQDAARLLRITYSQLEQTVGERDPRTIEIIAKLGNTSHELGHDNEGASYRARAYELAKATFGPLHPTTGDYANNLAIDYMDGGRFQEASTLLQAAVDAWSKAYGKDHPNLVFGYHNLGYLEHCRGNLEKARAWFWQAIRLGERIHANVGLPYQELGAVESSAGRYLEAERLVRIGLANGDSIAGTRVRWGAMIGTLGLGNIFLAAGRLDSAEVYLRECLWICDRLGRDRDPGAEAMLGVCLAREGRSAEAAPLLRKAHVTSASLGKRNYSRRWYMTRLASFYAARGDSAEAAHYSAARDSLPM